MFACIRTPPPSRMSPQSVRGVIRWSKAWDSIDKAVLSLSYWQEPLLWTAKSVCRTERRKEAAATACWRINKSLKRCPELTDQDRSNNGNSSLREFLFKFCSVLFYCLALSTSSFSLLLYLASVSGLPSLSILSTWCEQRWKEVRAWQVLPGITRDINFTFQSLLFARTLSLPFCDWISNIGRKELLLGTWFSSFWAVTDKLTGSTNFTHVHTHTQCKERQTNSFLCYCLHYVALKMFHPAPLIPSKKQLWGTGRDTKLSNTISCCQVSWYVIIHHNVTHSLYLTLKFPLWTMVTKRQQKEKKKSHQEIILWKSFSCCFKITYRYSMSSSKASFQ